MCMWSVCTIISIRQHIRRSKDTTGDGTVYRYCWLWWIFQRYYNMKMFWSLDFQSHTHRHWEYTKHNIWFMILITESSFISQSTIGGGCDFPDVQFRFSQSPIWYCRSSPVICGPSLGRSAMKTKTYIGWEKVTITTTTLLLALFCVW